MSKDFLKDKMFYTSVRPREQIIKVKGKFGPSKVTQKFNCVS